ncbi:MAG: transglycosylase SLT domain-containing protein, partial [bacterium]
DEEALEMSDAEFKQHLLKPDVSLRYGRHYLDKMLRRYGGDVDAALVAYNGGPKRADRWIKSGRDDSVLPRETRKYYKSVLRRARHNAAQGTPEGLIEPGTIDPADRKVVQDPESGDPMTVRTISIGTDQGEVLIPTISPRGKPLSDEDAVRLYRRTGDHLGIFENPEQATEYAESLSKQQGRRLAGGTYTALTAEDRRKLSDKLETAARNQMQQKVDDAAEQLRRTGTAEIDDQGRTALERARPILTRHQYEEAKLNWARARIEYDALHDLEQLPEADMQERLDRIAPADGEQYYEMKARAYDDAVRKAEEIRELRDNDPAAAVTGLPEVEEAEELVRDNPDDPEAILARSQARIDAQDRVGIPPGLQTPITNLEARVIMAPTRGLEGGALYEALEGVAEDLQAKYGPYARAAGVHAIDYIVKNKEVAEDLTGLIGRAMQGLPVSAAKIRDTEHLNEIKRGEAALTAEDSPLQHYGLEAIEGPRGAEITADPQEYYGMRRLPPQRAIDALRANPTLRDQFDQYYGPGSADKVLEDQGR